MLSQTHLLSALLYPSGPGFLECPKPAGRHLTRALGSQNSALCVRLLSVHSSCVSPRLSPVDTFANYLFPSVPLITVNTSNHLLKASHVPGTTASHTVTSNLINPVVYTHLGLFPGGSAVKNPLLCKSHRRHVFHPWVGKIPWRRARQPTLVFLPGKFHGQRSLAGYSPWGRKESDTTKAT